MHETTVVYASQLDSQVRDVIPTVQLSQCSPYNMATFAMRWMRIDQTKAGRAPHELFMNARLEQIQLLPCASSSCHRTWMTPSFLPAV